MELEKRTKQLEIEIENWINSTKHSNSQRNRINAQQKLCTCSNEYYNLTGRYYRIKSTQNSADRE